MPVAAAPPAEVAAAPAAPERPGRRPPAVDGAAAAARDESTDGEEAASFAEAAALLERWVQLDRFAGTNEEAFSKAAEAVALLRQALLPRLDLFVAPTPEGEGSSPLDAAQLHLVGEALACAAHSAHKAGSRAPGVAGDWAATVRRIGPVLLAPQL